MDLEKPLASAPAPANPAGIEKSSPARTLNGITTDSLRPITPARSSSSDPSPFSRSKVSDVGDGTREGRIARAAYARAERRGFAPGHEVEDWLAAEREVDGRTPNR
jgi:hypothetical protein